MFGNESTFKFFGNNDILTLNNDNYNSTYFGDNNSFKYIATNADPFLTLSRDINTLNNLFSDDSAFKFYSSQLDNENSFHLNNFSNTFTTNTPFGDEVTFLSLINTETNNYNLDNFPLNNQQLQSTMFGNSDTFISKVVDNLSENNTYNTLTHNKANASQKIFGNSYDFEYYSSENQAIDVQSLLSESQQVQTQKFWQKDCGQIDIGNLYANYEIQQPCDQPFRLYSRRCPCNNGNCSNNNRPNCNENCNNSSNFHYNFNNNCNTHKPNCNNNCNSPNNRRCSAEKLARKIYQQIIYASSCVAQLISQCSCPNTRQQLIDIKQNLDTIGISMLAITKVLCKCNPIYMNNAPDFNNNNFKHNLNKTIELLSIITQNLVHLQKLPEAKCYNMAILLITYSVIRQQNALINIISRC